MYDVIIVGAWPAGSVLATLLSNENIKVLLIEKLDTPKYNAWSGFLSRQAEKELGVQVPLDIMDKHIKTIMFVLKDKKFPIFFEERFGTTIDRLKFDLFLRDRAKTSKNVTFLNAKVVDAKSWFENSSITLENWEVITSKYLVGADGYKSIVSDRVFGYKFLQSNINYIALFEGVDLDEKLYHGDAIHFQVGDMEEYTYRLIFPYHSKYIVREGLGANREDVNELLKTLRIENDSDNLLIQALVIGANSGVNWKTNAILIWDAARLLDPITGEGLTNSIFSAKVAYQAFKEVFKVGNKSCIWDIYDKFMQERYKEIALKMSCIHDMSETEFLSKVDENLIRDYIKTVMGKVSFNSFFYKHALRKFPMLFIKSFFK